MSDQPLVSIVAVCYNHAQFVVETLDSIKAQNYPHIELLIMDDCSTDDSVAVIKEWIKHNNYDCTFIAHEENQGLCKTLNESLSILKGKYFQLVACDDTLLKTKIATQVALFDTLTLDYGLIYSDVGIMNNDSVHLEKTFYQESGYQPKTGEVYLEQVKTQFIKFMSCLCVSDYIRNVGGFDENLVFEDVDFFLRFAKEYKFQYMEGITGYWRKHDDNMTNVLYTSSVHLETRLVAYLKHVGLNNEIDAILKPKIIKLIKLLFKQKVFIEFDNRITDFRKNDKTLFWFYKNRISYRLYLLYIYSIKYFKQVKMCFADRTDLPPQNF
jgi:glycosyltransferase involved in cell wall biosynthesis